MADDDQIAEPDDLTIENDWRLFRRIPPWQIVWDRNKGGPRPSSANFKHKRLSVDLEPVLDSNGLDWHFTLRDYPDFSLVFFTAGQARSQQQAIVRDSLPENTAHGVVVGAKPNSVVKAFIALTQWVHLFDEHNV